jgi:hypothetical protein
VGRLKATIVKKERQVGAALPQCSGLYLHALLLLILSLFLLLIFYDL